MFLLSDRLIQHYMSKRTIEIEGFEPDGLHSAYYYFRLGVDAKIVSPEEGSWLKLSERNSDLVIPPNGLARVESLERFRIESTVLAQIGNASSLVVDKCIQLLHGVSIDPAYSGHLALNLLNLNSHAVTLRRGDRIGKILFYDISDTGLESAAIASQALNRAKQMDDVR